MLERGDHEQPLHLEAREDDGQSEDVREVRRVEAATEDADDRRVLISRRSVRDRIAHSSPMGELRRAGLEEPFASCRAPARVEEREVDLLVAFFDDGEPSTA